MKWTTIKPNYACVFVGRLIYEEDAEYEINYFSWEIGEPPEDAEDTETTNYYYLAWLNKMGDEEDSYDDCDYDEYLVIQLLPTMDEVHQNWIREMQKGK